MPCNINSYDGNNPDFYNNRIIKSRKEHRCNECGVTIPFGQNYQRIKGKWDGRILTYKICTICSEIRNVLFDDQIYYTELWDNLSDCLSDLTIKDIDKLSVRAIDKIEKKFSYFFHDNDEEEED